MCTKVALDSALRFFDLKALPSYACVGSYVIVKKPGKQKIAYDEKLQ